MAKLQNSLMKGSCSCRCSTTLGGQREAIQKSVCTTPKTWQHVQPNPNQDTGASNGPRQKIRGGTPIPTNLKENMILSHCRSLTYLVVILLLPLSSPPYFQRQHHDRLDSWGREEEITTFQDTFDNTRFSSKPYWQAVYFAFTIKFASGMRLKMRYLHREDRKKKSKSISTPTSYHYYVKTTGKCHKLETTRCYKSLRIARRWFTGVPNNSGENSEPKYSWDSRFRAILNDHVKTAVVTGIEVFQSAGTLAIEVKIPSQQSGNMKCWVRISRGIEQYARQFIPSETDHPNLEAAASQQSISCGRPRAQGIGGNSTVRYERCAKAKAYINCSQSTSLEIGPSNNVTQKGWWIRTHLPALHEHLATSRLSWIRRSSTVGSCFDKHAKCWANSVLVHRKMDWCTESFYWQTRNGVLWGSWRNDFFFLHSCQCKDKVMVPQSIQLFLYKEILMSWKEPVFHTGCSNYLSIPTNCLCGELHPFHLHSPALAQRRFNQELAPIHTALEVTVSRNPILLQWMDSSTGTTARER